MYFFYLGSIYTRKLYGINFYRLFRARPYRVKEPRDHYNEDRNLDSSAVF